MVLDVIDGEKPQLRNLGRGFSLFGEAAAGAAGERSTSMDVISLTWINRIGTIIAN